MPSSISFNCFKSNQRGRMMNQLFSDTTRSALAVAATGMGKTVLMSAMIKHWPLGRIMMISHRFELNDQARKTFEKFCGEPVDFEQSIYRADQCSFGDRCRTIVASVQTLNSMDRNTKAKRFARFDPNEFGLILIDEAHRAVAATYRSVLAHFQQNPNCYVLGVTATPDRLDKVGLKHVFEKVACDLNIRWAIDNGWLVPIRQKFVRMEGLDLDSLNTRSNDLGEKDFSQAQLAKILEQESEVLQMAYAIVKETGNEQTIIFTASVEQAHKIAEVINRIKPGSAASIDGQLPPMHPARRQIIADFKNCKYQYIANCGVLTEGFDACDVSVIAMARPTASRAFYCQCVGRGTRPLPGTIDFPDSTPERRKASILSSAKPFCTVLDFVGQSTRHKLVCTGDILAGENEPGDIVDAAKDFVKRGKFDGDMLKAIEKAKEEEEARRAAIAARKAKIVAKASYTVEEVDTWSPTKMVPPRTAKGFAGSKPPSEKMAAALQKFGFDKAEVEAMNFQQARAALNRCFERVGNRMSSIKQIRLLARFGVRAEKMTHADASAAIDAIAKNGWKRPVSPAK